MGYSVDAVSFFEATAANTASLVGKEFHEAVAIVDWNRDGADDLLFAQRSLRGRSGTDNSGYSYPVVHTFSEGLYTFDRNRSLTAHTPFRNICSSTYSNSDDPRRRWQDGISILGNDRTTGDLFCVNDVFSRTVSGDDNQTLHFSRTIRKLSTSTTTVVSATFPKISRFLASSRHRIRVQVHWVTLIWIPRRNLFMTHRTMT